MSKLAYLWDVTAWWKRRQSKLQERDETECGLRVVSGSQPGLTSRWRHGVTRVEAGHLEFLPRLGGSRIRRPGQPWLSIDVVEASRADERVASGREQWSVNPTARIVRIRTASAELEWAVSAEQRDWALSLVGNRP